MTREMTLMGSSSGDVADHYEALRFLTAHADRFEWDLIFSEPYPLSEVNTALQAMAGLSVAKAVVDTSR
jgi:hypothetical protein